MELADLRGSMWSYLARFLSFRDLAGYRPADLRHDLPSAVAVTFMAVPQAVAYAMIAGLPPAMGLYAAALPVVFGSLFRSSRYVVSGPTNAVSLVVGTAVAAHVGGGDPVTTAVTLAFMVGLMQLLAGLANLGALVDYISTSVVLGYITGAGVLIAVGQLPNVTGTAHGDGHLPGQLVGWIQGLGGIQPASVALALGTAGLLVALRRFTPKLPGAVIALAAGIALSAALDLGGRGIPLARDLAPVPRSLPSLTLPSFGAMYGLLHVAIAVMVLSLVESNAVARNIAIKAGERIDTNAEFAGQGIANLVAGFFSGYPISGSLSRSVLNYDDGARSRLSGTLSGVLMLVVLVALGPLLDLTPVASLAGLLLVIAVDLVDVPQIRSLLRSRPSDQMAFVATLVGTFLLPLDEAIYAGVVISLILFLRRARLLTVREMAVDGDLRLRERVPGQTAGCRGCRAIRVLHVEGSLFFGAANELRDALFDVVADRDVRVLVVRIKRTRGLDFTTATVLEEAHRALEEEGRHMLLVGIREKAMRLIEKTGIADEIGHEHLYPTQPGWFVAMHEALEQALVLVGEHTCQPDGCPLHHYAERRIAK